MAGGRDQSAPGPPDESADGYTPTLAVDRSV